MADKKLNSLAMIPTLNDIANIYVEDKDGVQYKVSKESLASVLGGLIGVATLQNNGLMPAGLFYKLPNTVYIEPNGTYDLGAVNGFVGIRNGYSWNGYELHWCSGGVATKIAGTSYTIPQTITYSNEKWILTNTDATRQRAFQIFVQNIPI